MTSRRSVLRAAGALAAAPVAAWADVVTTPGARTALVIGNQRYKLNPLGNPASDARAMATLFKDAGFTVDLRVDATRAGMAAAIEAYTKNMAGGGVTLGAFYYAGHAAQLEWRNYLLPVDGNVEAEGDIRRQCIDLGTLLAPLAKLRGKTALVILDACRDDPFGARLRLRDKGLSQYDAPAGSLLAFATAPGRVAVELAGAPHGLYTEHLLRELPVRGVRVEDALKRVRLGVRLASRGSQVPWESTSLETDLFLYPTRRLSEAELEARFKDELALWSRIKTSREIEDWNQYLRRFPDGNFAEVAQMRLNGLIAEGEKQLAKPAPPARKTAPAKPPAAAQVVLGAGRPIPLSMRASENPNSAGTFPWRPVWTPGDEYVYQQRDILSNVVKRTYKVGVKRVDIAKDRVELTNGSILDLLGATLHDAGRTFDVPIQFNPAELQVGRHWSSRFVQASANTRGRGEYEFRVIGREKVTVPAGDFLAFKIEGSGWFVNSAGERTPIRVVRWVVPGLNLPIRVDTHQFGTLRLLISARQAVAA